MSTWTEWLRAQIDASDSPDPHVIAAQALTVMPPTYRRDALVDLLPDAVRYEIRQQRDAVVSGPAAVGSKGVVRSEACAAMAAMSSDPSRMREYVPGVGWKFQADLTVADLEAQAVAYDLRAGANAAKASERRGWAAAMVVAGVAVLGDLAGWVGSAA